MIFTTLFVASSLYATAMASPQIYGPPAPGPASPTTSTPAAAPTAPPDTPGNMNINVAFQETFTFNPANITAPNGTLVTFWFPNNGLTHSVTQSSFDAPCTYLAASDNSSAGFNSGLVENVQFTINITDDTQPIWFHCTQVDHCGMGMVGSINAPTSGSNTFSAFQAAAMSIGSSEVQESATTAVTGGVNAIATATPAATGAGSSGSGSSGSSGAVTSDATKIVAGISVNLFAAALAIALL